MVENKQLICINLYKKLKEKFDEQIFVNINDNILSVHIKTKRGNRRKYTYKCNVNNINTLYLIDTVHDIERDYYRFTHNLVY